jgi:hypothetical protein
MQAAHCALHPNPTRTSFTFRFLILPDPFSLALRARRVRLSKKRYGKFLSFDTTRKYKKHWHFALAFFLFLLLTTLHSFFLILRFALRLTLILLINDQMID